MRPLYDKTESIKSFKRGIRNLIIGIIFYLLFLKNMIQ